MKERLNSENDFRTDDLSEPSLYVVSENVHIGSSFTDISFISRSELNFIAKGIRFGKWFIIKGLNPNHQTDAFALSMLRKEFEILFQIVHPNIRRAVNFEILEDLGHCIILDYCDGPDLRNWLKEKRPVEERLKIANELADAISYIHGKGIVHRDIKPENIIISRIGNTPVIIDFGLSDSDGFAILKEPGGSPSYISPEQATSNVPDPRNDIYSYGKLLKELLPEKKFASVVSICLKEISKRPSDINVVKNRLSLINKRNRFISWVAAAVVLILISLVFLFTIPLISPDTPTQNLNSKTDTIPAVIAEEGSNDTIYAGPSIHSVLKPPIPEDESPGNTPAGVFKNSSYPPEPKIQAEKSNKMTPAEAYNQMLILGRKAIDYCIDENTDAKDLPSLVNVKNQYIRSLKINVNSNSSFINQYPLENDDIDKINSELDNYLNELKLKWTIPTN